MQKARLPRSFWLVVAAVLILGCGIVWTDPPTPTPFPTETPTPLATATSVATSTNTPEPLPTPTFTMAPTQSISSIVKALQAAAEGNGVPDAAMYDPNELGIHPIVFFSISPEIADEWNNELPEAWRGQNVSTTELIAVIIYKEVKIERGHYFGSGISLYIWRIRTDTEVILRETQTGNTVASTVFEGGEPPSLKGRYSIGTTAVYGTLVPYEIVELWLESFVEK